MVLRGTDEAMSFLRILLCWAAFTLCSRLQLSRTLPSSTGENWFLWAEHQQSATINRHLQPQSGQTLGCDGGNRTLGALAAGWSGGCRCPGLQEREHAGFPASAAPQAARARAVPVRPERLLLHISSCEKPTLHRRLYSPAKLPPFLLELTIKFCKARDGCANNIKAVNYFKRYDNIHFCSIFLFC